VILRARKFCQGWLPHRGRNCYYARPLLKIGPVITDNPMTALERRTVGTLALLYCFRMLGLFMVLPLLALYAGDFTGASPALIGLALGIYGLSQALLQIPFGWLSDRIGRKPVIVGGLIVFALGSLVAATADSIGGIVLGRALQGAGAIAGTIMALLADLTRDEQRTKAMAVVGISIGMSFALALVLGPLMAASGGLSGVFYLTAVLAVAGIALVWLVIPAPPAHRMKHADTGAVAGLLSRSILDVSLARLNLGVFILHFILMACFLVVPQLLESNAGVTREQHWKIYLIALALSVLAMAPMMRAAERGRRPQQMFVLAILCILLALFTMGLNIGAIAVYFGLWLFFTGFNYLEATLPSLVSKIVFSGGKGTALGVYSTSQFLGAFAGGAGGGWLLQHYSATVLFGLCASLAALWIVIAVPMRLSAAMAVETSGG
jgi:MFS family permease